MVNLGRSYYGFWRRLHKRYYEPEQEGGIARYEVHRYVDSYRTDDVQLVDQYEYERKTDFLIARIRAQPWPEERKLTPQQLLVLQYFSRGLKTNTEVGEAMGISMWTVDSHLRLARKRLRAKTTTHACCEAIRKGLIP